ncbi:MAG TPA: sigma-70 family RNA polymerase sigma factor [Gemmatimonadaceae bacterium]|nr:sigma-70 family RNA polymerase sigma factor [Gemmatimonadaceae bacterium]
MTIAPTDDAHDAHDALDRGTFDARYLAFLSTVQELRPSLHRYCARMTGSVADGEDVVQEALFVAYRRLDSFDDARPLKPWLFRIAHNRCIDFLRSRGVREDAEAGVDSEDAVWPDDPPGPALGRAVEHLVLTLPPMERACVLLKDVLDHSLEEIAELTGSTVGGVKAALHRGRAKLATESPAESMPRASVATSARDAAVLVQYVERFNRRDWDGLRELVRADARVRVADRFTGPIADSGYFGRYAQLATRYRLVLAELDGAPMIVAEYDESGVWVARGIMRVQVRDGRVEEIADYKHCPWVLGAAGEIRLHAAS